MQHDFGLSVVQEARPRPLQAATAQWCRCVIHATINRGGSANSNGSTHCSDSDTEGRHGRHEERGDGDRGGFTERSISFNSKEDKEVEDLSKQK